MLDIPDDDDDDDDHHHDDVGDSNDDDDDDISDPFPRRMHHGPCVLPVCRAHYSGIPL